MLLSAAVGQAQQTSLTGRGTSLFGQGNGASDAILQRQLRSLERGDASSPDAAAMQLRSARQNLVQQSRGAALTTEQARINRGLDRARPRPPAASAGCGDRPDTPARPRGERLPGTIAQDPVLPSFGGTTTLGRLVGRAEAAIAAGRPAQAQSDLATARSLVGSIDTALPGEKEALAALQNRMVNIDTRLAGTGG